MSEKCECKSAEECICGKSDNWKTEDFAYLAISEDKDNQEEILGLSFDPVDSVYKYNEGEVVEELNFS